MNSTKQQFIDKVRSLNMDQLKELFEELQADPKTDLGMLMFISKEYADRSHGLSHRRILN